MLLSILLAVGPARRDRSGFGTSFAGTSNLDITFILAYSNVVMQASQQLNKPKLLLRATPKQRAVAAGIWIAVVAFFSVFAVAGHYKVDMGYFLGRCGLKQNTGLPCPTCGMTTATLAFAQGKILQAFYIQPAGAFLCSVLVFAAILSFFISLFGIYFRFVQRFFTEVKLRYVLLALIIIILSGWIVTFTRALAEKY